MFAPPINHLSQEEHDSAIEEMKTFEGLAFEPSVGIFWFDPDKGELFDTASCPVSTLNPKLDTISVLHKNIWAKNYCRAKARGKTDSIYFTDYTQIPRGRIFYNRKTRHFR
ncbi:MAG: hypothetical protein NC048_05460 [Bacteroides sp.]|nr:hypothetical protein [Ruminococcus flavefaciens]MCM1554925.1 hypothetical protein [Bacteroides sp.]